MKQQKAQKQPTKILLTRFGGWGHIYKDGGTEEFMGSDGQSYFLNKRISDPNRGKLFTKYPTDKGAEIVNVKWEIINEYARKS